VGQLVLNGIASGSIYGIVALGFALIYQATRFFHFSHAAVFTVGAYGLFLGFKCLHLPIAVAVAGSLAASAGLGAALEFTVYRPLRKRGASTLALLIASIGVYIAIQNVLSLVATDDTLSLRSGGIREGLALFDARITPIQVIAILVNVGCYIASCALFTLSCFGKRLRCVAEDPDLAVVVGIRKEVVVMWTFVAGSVLAGTGGMLFAMDVDMNPSMGLHVLMLALVAGIVGGMRTVHGRYRVVSWLDCCRM